MTSSSQSQLPLLPQVPLQPPSEDGPEQWLKQFWVKGVTASWGEKLSLLGRRAAISGLDADMSVSLRAFAAMAAMGRGDYDLADELLGAAMPAPGSRSLDSSRPPLAAVSPSVLLLDSAARLYRACGDAERDPERAITAMHELSEARRLVGTAQTVEAATARGYAALSLAEALLMVGDVGAARHQLELVIEKGQAPPVLLTSARSILCGIELAVGRSDLAIGHLQAAVREAAGHQAEEQTARLLLCGVMLSTNRRYGLALLEEFLTRNGAKPPPGQGTVARLFRMLQLLSGNAPFSLPIRAEIRDLLRFLQGRHYSAGWFLLLTAVCSGALRGAGDICEAYSVLIHAAATLRCRRMEGAADLCDRQIEALRSQLGEDQFEALLSEAQSRRRVFLSYLDQREEQRS